MSIRIDNVPEYDAQEFVDTIKHYVSDGRILLPGLDEECQGSMTEPAMDAYLLNLMRASVTLLER
jgi:hypothetical protein